MHTLTYNPMKRRVLIIAGILFFSLVFQVSFAQTDSLRRYEFAHPQMGTVFRLTLYASHDSVAQPAAQAAFRRIDELNAILSDYQPDSELSRLSAMAGSGQAVKVSDDLWRVLLVSQQAARLSGGAFDITIGPLANLWRRARRQHELPAAPLLKKARQSVGYQHIRLYAREKKVMLLKPGMKLDAGGIGKGYAVDEALKIVSRRGIKPALVDAGSNLAIGDAPPGKNGWRVAIGIGPPSDTARATYLMLAHTSVSTSGDAFQFVDIGGKRYSHIVSPFTGYGLTDSRTVSVVSPNGATADWLSTAICVMGNARAKKMLKTIRQTTVWVWEPDGKSEKFGFQK